MKQTILHLDDDASLLDLVADNLKHWNYEVISCSEVKSAILALEQSPAFAVVDVFLAGESGKQLSNSFVKDHLEPNGVRYGRLTSAPSEVGEDVSGDWVLDKRLFRRDTGMLRERLIESGLTTSE